MTERTNRRGEKRQKRQYTDKIAIDAYELAREGYNNTEIAEIIGIGIGQFNKWISQRRVLKYALEKARRLNKEREEKTLEDYVYDRLPDELKEVWDELMEIEEEDNGLKRVEALLRNRGKRTRQYLFLHALVNRCFNASEACKVVGIAYNTFQYWCRMDPDFQALIDEMILHKKNFYESHLHKLVKEGNAQAVIFANKTFNRDRGYNEKQEIEVNQNINHNVTVVEIGKLNLPLDVMKQVLEAIRAQRGNQTQDRVVDAEYKRLEENQVEETA